MNNQEEIWKDIPNYEGLYQVSNLGRVKSLDRYIWNRFDFVLNKGSLMSSTDNGKGYLAIRLSKNNIRKTFRVHQLVAMAFLGHIPCGYKMIVDHINNNKLDNRVENLQIITSRENTSKDKKSCSSKYTGVCWDKSRGSWISSIRIGKKRKYLGRFNKEIDAHFAYQKALKNLTIQ